MDSRKPVVCSMYTELVLEGERGMSAECSQIIGEAALCRIPGGMMTESGTRVQGFWNRIYNVKMLGAHIHSVPKNFTVRYKLTPPGKLSMSKLGR